MDFKARGAEFAAANVANERFWFYNCLEWFRTERINTILTNESIAHLLMFYQGFRAKSPSTAFALLKYLIVELIGCGLVVELDFTLSLLAILKD